MTILDLSGATTVGIVGTAAAPVSALRMAGRTQIRITTFADASNINGDALAEIDVSTGIKIGDTPQQMAQRYQVKAKYVFSNP
jgi:hypothetical protein